MVLVHVPVDFRGGWCGSGGFYLNVAFIISAKTAPPPWRSRSVKQQKPEGFKGYVLGKCHFPNKILVETPN